MEKCPVCQRPIAETFPGAVVEYGGRSWLLCSQECKRQFELAPQMYTKI